MMTQERFWIAFTVVHIGAAVLLDVSFEAGFPIAVAIFAVGFAGRWFIRDAVEHGWSRELCSLVLLAAVAVALLITVPGLYSKLLAVGLVVVAPAAAGIAAHVAFNRLPLLRMRLCYGYLAGATVAMTALYLWALSRQDNVSPFICLGVPLGYFIPVVCGWCLVTTREIELDAPMSGLSEGTGVARREER